MAKKPLNQPRVFISYSSLDVKVAEQVHASLEAEGFEVWRDKKRIEKDWSREIAFALADSDAVCLLWSEHAADSKYVSHEWLTARALEKTIVVCRLGRYKNYPKPLHNLQDVKFDDVDEGSKRLCEKLKNISDFHVRDYDYSLLSKNNYIPFNHNENFTGRHRDLLELYLKMIGNLNNIGINQIGTIGMGGIGKTQLVVEFAYRFSFAFDSVFWFQAADTDRWQKQFVELARDRLQLPIQDPDKPFASKQYIFALQKHFSKNPGSLIIMDNIIEPEQLNNDTYLFGLTPLSLRCNLLFTTRKQFKMEGVSAQAVDILPPEAAYAMLNKYRNPESEGAEQPARAICNAVGSLPLAIALVGSYLREYPDVSFGDYYEELLKNKLGVVDIGEVSQEELATRHIAAVSITLEEDWKRIDNEDARYLFRLTGQFDEAEIIPKARLGLLAAIPEGKSKLHRPLDKAFNLLQNHSLVEEIKNDTGAIRLHPLVREYANNLVKKDEQGPFVTHAAENLKEAYHGYRRLRREVESRGVIQVIDDLQTGIDWYKNEDQTFHFLSTLRSCLRLSSHIIGKSSGQLASQLTGRLIKASSKEIDNLLEDCLANQDAPWLRPYSLGLIQAGSALQQTFSGMNIINGVLVTPDNKFALCHDEDSIIWVWDLLTAELNQSFETSRSSWIKCSDMHPTQSIAVVAKEDGGIYVVDISASKLTHELRSGAGQSDISFSQDGLSVWTAHTDGVVESRPLDGSSDPVKIDIGWDDIEVIIPGTKNHALLAVNSSIEEWDLETPERVSKREGYTGSRISALALSHDGSYLAAGFDDGSIDLWNLEQESRIALGGHKGKENRNIIADLAFTPGGGKLISGSWDSTLMVWDIPGGNLSATLEGHSSSVYSLASYKNGTRAISSSKDGTLRTWDLTIKSIPGLSSNHKFAVDALASRNDFVVSGSRDRVICTWDLSTARENIHWTAHEGVKPHEGWIHSVAIDPLGSRIYSASKDGFLRSWDTDGNMLKSIKGDWGTSSDMNLAKNGSLLVSSMRNYPDVKLSLWRPSNKKRIARVVFKQSSLGKIAVSDDGLIVIGADLDGGFDVVDTQARKTLWSKRKKETRYSNYQESIVISSDNRKAIFGFKDGNIEIWDLDKKALTNNYELHTDRVIGVDFSPDGALACSASWDRTLKLWELETGKQIAAFSSDDFWASCIFADDASHIIAGDERGGVHLLYLEGLGNSNSRGNMLNL